MMQVAMKIGPLFLAAGMLACGSDSTSPTESMPVGSYTAFEFVTTGSSGQTDQLLIGSTLEITLSAAGTTSGHLHMAAQGGQAAFDADMAGTWTRTGNTVDFTQNADTFVNDMIFTIQPVAADVWDLEGDQAFSGTLIQLTLRHGP
jgi:hypothetical protein